ncbi:MAG: 4-hydroxythreonine-4-phosphate dehydrogenase [Bacteroidota bacterium]
MPADFIFMLTRNDKTVPNSLACAQEAISAQVTNIGLKDVGVSNQQLKAVIRILQKAKVTTYLEVVSLDAQSELKSAEMALQFGVDFLLGGTRPQLIAPLVKNHPIKYYPFVGKITGHPSQLLGTIQDIALQARQISSIEGVDGLDLLAYRYKGDVPKLIQAVNQASFKPIIIAGSIHNKERIELIESANVQGFTIGTAAFENRFNRHKSGLRAQLEAILEIVV